MNIMLQGKIKENKETDKKKKPDIPLLHLVSSLSTMGITPWPQPSSSFSPQGFHLIIREGLPGITDPVLSRP
jgi:hypothetical protein